MTDPSAATPEPDDVDVLDLEPDALDGHSIDELADYLDAGMLPADSSIDESPACQNALAALARIRTLSHGALDLQAAEEDPADESWIQGLLANISLEARAGRPIPLTPTAPTERAVLTEGAVRAIIRRAGDSVNGILVGRCVLDGDVTVPGAPVRVQVWATVLYGQPIHDAAALVRAAVTDELRRHTELNLAAVDVTIRDVRLPNEEPLDD